MCCRSNTHLSRPALRACCTLAWRRCCPRSTSWVQLTCILVILGFFITGMFGRSLTSTILGTLSIIFSLEAYFAAQRGDRRMLRYYAIFMVLNTIVSVAVGVMVLTGVDIECAAAQNEAACASTQVVYGLSMALGASSFGLFAAINIGLVSLTLPAKPAEDPEEKMLDS